MPRFEPALSLLQSHLRLFPRRFLVKQGDWLLFESLHRVDLNAMFGGFPPFCNFCDWNRLITINMML